MVTRLIVVTIFQYIQRSYCYVIHPTLINIVCQSYFNKKRNSSKPIHLTHLKLVAFTEILLYF